MSKLTRLGGDECPDGRTCPAAYAVNDGTKDMIINGWVIEDPEIMAELPVPPPGESAVRIPASIVEVIRRAGADGRG